jgi:hypothetical protein
MLCRHRRSLQHPPRGRQPLHPSTTLGIAARHPESGCAGRCAHLSDTSVIED